MSLKEYIEKKLIEIAEDSKSECPSEIKLDNYEVAHLLDEERDFYCSIFWMHSPPNDQFKRLIVNKGRYSEVKDDLNNFYDLQKVNFVEVNGKYKGFNFIFKLIYNREHEEVKLIRITTPDLGTSLIVEDEKDSLYTFIEGEEIK